MASTAEGELIGSIEMTAIPWAISGYAIAAGQLLPVSQNTTLFTVIGANFGGDAVNTFGLPNLASRLPIGMGQGQGLSPYPLGAQAGVESVQMTAANLPPHAHPVSLGGTGTGSWATSGSGVGTPGASTAETLPTGNGVPMTNMPPVLAINFQIALTGMFPSRA